ncbi:hypothetical protein [Chitinimonas sp. BJYL2]|uniref:hypothetical protein n=1 Tax=Chitinimonas sp. BJYL2 TaxID=2976696 RepID=UPI0022B3AAB7|nr:hypothetical protein [Chitinimonas sp. BJYL2]
MLLAHAAPTLVLRLPELPSGQHRYYTRLLEQSLKQIGQPVRIELVADIPPARMWHMMKSGELTILFALQTAERDRQFAALSNNLTNGLIGQRVLMIRPEDQARFDRVDTLAALRGTGLVAGFGRGWFDAKVWRANGLEVYEHPVNLNSLYAMVRSGTRGVDYLPRGINEIGPEAREHKELAIEKNLLLVYERDMRFYLSPRIESFRPILMQALLQADKSGLKKRLIDEEFGPEIKAVQPAKRRKIVLLTPRD